MKTEFMICAMCEGTGGIVNKYQLMWNGSAWVNPIVTCPGCEGIGYVLRPVKDEGSNSEDEGKDEEDNNEDEV